MEAAAAGVHDVPGGLGGRGLSAAAQPGPSLGERFRRLGFSAAIKRIEAGKADLIVVADHGRLFRDIDVQRAAIDRVEGAGGQLWAVSSGRITHETADAELMANLTGSIDHYQRRYAREKSFLAVELAIEKGKVPWPGEIPGYIRDADSRLTPGDEIVAVIVRAFEIRKDGATIDAVRAYLLANGIEISYTATQHLLGDRIENDALNWPHCDVLNWPHLSVRS